MSFAVVRARRAAPVALLLGLCAALFVPGLLTGQFYRNEGLRALPAVELLRGGHWAVPTLHGEPLLTKPPGMAVAIALASYPQGRVTGASARAPSALAATLAVLLFYGAFARALGRRAGLLAAVLLPASLLWLDRSSSAEIDMVQLAWVTASVLFLVRAVEVAETSPPPPGPLPHSGGRGRKREGGASFFLPSPSASGGDALGVRGVRGGGEGSQGWWREWAWWQAALLCVAGGLLTKWTAPAFFYLTALPWLAWRGRLRLLTRPPHLLAVAGAALPCLAWLGAAAAAVGWQALVDTVGREALQRLSPAHHPRPYPWRELVTFPGSFLLACLPWSACALLTLRPGFTSRLDGRALRLLQACHCWAWVNLLFWTVVPGHRPRHALPLQPALAGLAALAWVGAESRERNTREKGDRCSRVAGAESSAPRRGAAYRGGVFDAPATPLRRSPLRLGIGALVLLTLAAKLTFLAWLVPERDRKGQPRGRGQRLAELVPEGAVLYLFRLKDEGILFYYGRPTRRLPDPRALPAGSHCLLVEAEWRRWPPDRPATVRARLSDEQGAPLVLVEVRPPQTAGDLP